MTTVGGEDERMGWWHLPSSVASSHHTTCTSYMYVFVYFCVFVYLYMGHTIQWHTCIAMHQILMYGMVWYGATKHHTMHHRCIAMHQLHGSLYCVVNKPQAPPAVPMHATPQGHVRTHWSDKVKVLAGTVYIVI